MPMVVLVLISDILSDHFHIKTNGIYTITSGPKVVIPIGFLLQLLKFVENPCRGPTFQSPYKV